MATLILTIDDETFEQVNDYVEVYGIEEETVTVILDDGLTLEAVVEAVKE